MRLGLLLALAVLLCGSASAETLTAQGGPVPYAIQDSDPTRAIEWRQVRANLRKLAQRPGVAYSSEGTLNFPLRSKPWSLDFAPNGISNHVDLGSGTSLLDYTCGQRTYTFQGYQHSGTDLFLTPFPWTMMANEEVDVVAAIGGTVVYTHDGEFDQNCSLSSTAVPNVVYVSQDDGMIGRYLHLKTGSQVVTLGERVEQGQKLANVGSSGSSTAPHLHYEVARPDGTILDPFAGQCNPGATGWRAQWGYNSSIVTRITTHATAPIFGDSSCDQNEPVVQQSFNPGDTVYVAIYMRDMLQGQSADWQVFDSQGTLQQSVSTGPLDVAWYAEAYWYQALTLASGAAPGSWRIRANFQGQTTEAEFFVGAAPAQTVLAASILPSGRSIQASGTATAFATILNGGTVTATGCGLYPVAPLDAGFSFQATDPATNAPIGQPDQVVDIAPGQGQSFVLAITPNSDAVSRAFDLPFNFFCANAPVPTAISGVNTLLLSISQTPVPDILAIAATESGDGYLDTPQPGGSSAFSLAALDNGAAGSLSVTPRTMGGLAAVINICETNPADGSCRAAPAPSAATDFGTGETHTYSAFVSTAGFIIDDPAANRIYVDFTDAAGVSRGATSVAVRTH